MALDAIALTWNEALSGITGSISLAAWIFLLLPQLIENYQQGSAEGISLTFLFIWFVGDVTNLAGALWAGLVPTVTALAVYFCFADAILIGQCLYYNAVNRRRDQKETKETTANTSTTEATPLLNGSDTVPPAHKRQHSLTDIREDNLGLPGSRRRSSAATCASQRARHRTTSSATLDRILEEPSESHAYLKNTLSVLLILLVGTAGWAIAWRSGAWRPTPVGPGDEEEGGEGTPLGAEILGYASAVCYLGARVPQILKNQHDRSCDGLSLLFFVLSVLGNATYGAGILLHSVEKRYFLTNLPWLIGSLGTMAEDAVIFVQFSVFGERRGEGGEGESAVE